MEIAIFNEKAMPAGQTVDTSNWSNQHEDHWSAIVMIGILGHYSALVRLYCDGDNLG